MKSGSTNLRKFAISHLRLLLRRNVADFWQWCVAMLHRIVVHMYLLCTLIYCDFVWVLWSTRGVGLLVLQLQGKDIDVALAALSVLEESCAQASIVHILICNGW